MSPEQYEEVRRRVAADVGGHSFAQHLACLLAEREEPTLPSDPDSDESRHAHVSNIAARKFMTYGEALIEFERNVRPKLRERAELVRRMREVKREQAALAANVAEAKAAAPGVSGAWINGRFVEVPPTTHVRAIEHVARQIAARAAADNAPAKVPAEVCHCCESATPDCKCKTKTADGCRCRAACPQCAVLKCDALPAEARGYGHRPTLDAA